VLESSSVKKPSQDTSTLDDQNILNSFWVSSYKEKESFPVRQWSSMEGRCALVAVLSHFPELKSKLELLESERNADLSDDQADALWPLVSTTSDSLASLVPSSFAHDSPHDAEEQWWSFDLLPICFVYMVDLDD
jgi:hypothetical protein